MMKKTLLIAALSAFAALQLSCTKDPDSSRIPGQPASGQEQTDGDDLVKGAMRIKLSPELESRIDIAGQGDIVQFGVTPLDELAAALGASRIERTFHIGGKYEQRQRKAGLHLWYTVFFDETQTVTRAASRMMELDGILVAEPVYKIYPQDGGRTVVDNSVLGPVAQAAVAATRAETVPFNDPGIRSQWHYRNDGMQYTIFEAGADINLYKAWEITTGSSDVIVAVIDSAIDYAHVDLADNLWVNPSESGGTPGVDDDGNGYEDDIHGWNFYDNTPQSALITGDDGVTYGHGTHVAGTIGAVNNNGKGGGGVAGGDGTPGSGARIMACQINNGNSSSPDPNRILKAFQYAADNGAVIAQCSWGYATTVTFIPEADKDAIDYFTRYAGTDGSGEVQTGPLKGGLAIFAVGNWGVERLVYPAAYGEVLAVTSMNADFTIPTYAVRGTWVDVSAPGGSSLSGVGQAAQVYSTLPNDQYGYMYGTSMACPHVSGVAALLASKYGKERPGLTGKDIRQMIERSTNDIYVHNPTYAGRLGTGYVDAYRALAEADDSQLTPAAPEVVFTIYNKHVDMQLTIKSGVEGKFPHRYTVLMSERPVTNGDFDTAAADVTREELETNGKDVGGSFTISYPDLRPDTEYYFAVRAYTLFGAETTVSMYDLRTQNYNPPAEPSDLTVNLSGTSVLATWSVTADPDDTRALYYNLSYSTKNLETENWNDIAADITTVRVDVGNKLTGQELSYLITGLTSNKVYYMCVQGVDARTNVSEPVFRIFYTGVNSSPQKIADIQPLAFTTATPVQQIDLSQYFSNDDPLGLTYTLTADPANSLTYSIDGDVMTLSLADGFNGSGTFTVTATDFAGLSASSTAAFSANNNASTTVTQAVRDAMTVSFPAGATGNADIRVYNAAGNVVKSVSAAIPGSLRLDVDMKSVSSGVCTVVVKYGSREDKHRIVKL